MTDTGLEFQVRASILHCGAPGGAWLLDVYYEETGDQDSWAFRSYAWAQRYLTGIVAKGSKVTREKRGPKHWTFSWTVD